MNYRREDMIAPFVMALTRAYATMDEFLEEHDSMPERSELLDFYFDIAHFLNMLRLWTIIMWCTVSRCRRGSLCSSSSA